MEDSSARGEHDDGNQTPPAAAAPMSLSVDSDFEAPPVLNNMQRKYILVRGVDNDDDSNNNFVEEAMMHQGWSSPLSSSSLSSSIIWTTTLFPDTWTSIYGVVVLNGVEVVRLVKFIGWSLFWIALFHPVVRWIGWEHDEKYRFSDFLLYDFKSCLTDMVSFYVVGRLYQRHGVDALVYLLPLIAGIIYPSVITDVWWLRHSVTLYEMHCTWPWQLWVFAIAAIVLGVSVVIWHMLQAHREQILVSRLIELAVCGLLLIVPGMSNPSFHLHHWYFSWFMGMHANYNTWWSKATMAYCWGQYINGIVVYGRDPLLTCSYSYFLSTDQQCHYMKCYKESDNSGNHTHGHNASHYKKFEPPDWRNCSAAINH